MAMIKPFRAIRPERNYAKKIAALPYDVYNRQEAKKIVEQEPFSFLAIDRAETGFACDSDMYGEWVYERAGKLLAEWRKEGYFLQDEKPGFYLYELTFRGRVKNGIVAVSAIDDYLNGMILKHENTRKEKEQDRICHIESCQAQTGPVFMIYDDRKRLPSLIKEIKRKEAEYDFISEDGIRHRVFLIMEDEWIREIEAEFQKVDQVYIGDGHHRCAAAAEVCLRRRALEENYDKTAEYNYVLSVLFPQSEVEILDYNRLVRDLNGLSKEAFLEKLQNEFEIEEKKEAYAPGKKGEFGMYLEHKWYALRFRGEVHRKRLVDRLDVSILQDHCLGPILGIEDPRTDPRIDFSGGIRGMKELERRVHMDCKAAFSVKATSIEELMQAAKEGMPMPPKSTWFEPKLRSGLLIHDIEGEETP